jgi:asparagine synthase (glutamine-hydrolysing)
MCGIAGFIDCEKNPINPGFLQAMSRAIAHRGPDDEGYILINQAVSSYRSYSGPGSCAQTKALLPPLSAGTTVGGANLGLCHTRFSIIDLSEAGHQPLFDRQRSCCIVFNGEIYNYLELRAELQASGVVMQSQSDTEVLLESYKFWGTDCFSKFNGFWAVALYDFKRRQLILSRDRIGKKPLYWTKVETRLYFASEIKALLEIPEIHARRKVDEESISCWLAYGRKDLNDSTCFAGVRSFPAASWAVVTTSFPEKVVKFWKVPNQRLREKDISIPDAAENLRNTLEDAVRIRLRADVPLGVELSGGMDSSALVALAARNSSHKITTYTIRFPDAAFNEEPFARSVARFYNTDYQVLESPNANFWRQVLLFTRLEEEPYHSPVLKTNQVIWAQMRSRGSKISLNGAAGDENFAGYGQYFETFQRENFRNGRLSDYIGNALRYSESRTHLRPLLGPILRLAKNAAFPRSQDEERVPYFLGSSYPRPFLEPGTVSQALYDDMTNTLMPYWLRSGDRGFMGIPLEVRAPFLDYRLIEFAFQLPTTYLIRNGWQKWILRKAFEPLLPKDVVWRRHKMGFPFPYERFCAESKDILNVIVNESHNPYIDFSMREQFRHDWKTLSFLLWYELFFNENLPLFQKIEDLARRIPRDEAPGFTPEFLRAQNFSYCAETGR